MSPRLARQRPNGQEKAMLRLLPVAALLAFFAAPVVATERETKPARKLPARNRRSRSVGFAGLYAPLLDSRPETPSTKPPIDWERGDDIPF